MAKAAFSKKKTLFTNKLDSNLGTSCKVLHLEHTFVLCWNLDILESRSEIPGKFCNVLFDKDGEDQLHRSCEKWRSVTKSRGRHDFPTDNTKKEA